MANAPSKTLTFTAFDETAAQSCDECAVRRVNLPAPLPVIEDDFDWLVRDYDSVRMFMMEELAYRFPSRKRWTPADIEVVIVELLASQMDRMSHSLDVIHGEHFLATAKRPESVRRLLALIGYDAVAQTPSAAFDKLPPLPDRPDENGDLQPALETDPQKLERLWHLFPEHMESARAAGPRYIGEQHRMVTLKDHADRLMQHPLVERAQVRQVWTGAWRSILVSVLLRDAIKLDEPLSETAAGTPDKHISNRFWSEVDFWHGEQGLPLPRRTDSLTARHILRVSVDRYRMIGAEVFLEDARQVPLSCWLSVKLRDGYFRSEVQDRLMQVFSSDIGGVFEPGNLGFGEDVYASNIIEAAVAVEGVQTACLNRFKRMGEGWADQSDSGMIAIEPNEVAICQTRPGAPELGVFSLKLVGGETG